jgi:hypothetical protein
MKEEVSNDRPVRSQRVAERSVDGEMVLYDPELKCVHVLNPTAAYVWRMCDGTHAPTDIVAALVSHYPESRADIAIDVPSILESFRAADLFATSPVTDIGQ